MFVIMVTISRVARPFTDCYAWKGSGTSQCIELSQQNFIIITT